MSAPVHPSFTFRVNLALLKTEQIGPNTNVINSGVLHPSRHQNGQDNAQLEEANFKTTRSTWNPGLMMLNRVLKDGDEFTMTGEQALYLRNTYAVGYAPADRACLEII